MAISSVPYMIEASATIFINAPGTKVFDIAADPQKQLLWDAGNFTDLKSLTTGPLAKGSKFSCHVKGMGKMVYEFSEYEPHSRFVHQSRTWMSYGIHYFVVREVNNVSEFSQTMQMRLRNIGVLLYPFGERILKRKLLKQNQALKVFIEQNISG